jgi:hypothetical protein
MAAWLWRLRLRAREELGSIEPLVIVVMAGILLAVVLVGTTKVGEALGAAFENLARIVRG